MEVLLACPWCSVESIVPLATHESIYADRWLRISRGKCPRGFFDRLTYFLGFDSAKDTPRYSPADFQIDLGGGLTTMRSWASRAKVSRCPARPARSSYAISGSKRSLCLRETAKAKMRLIAELYGFVKIHNIEMHSAVVSRTVSSRHRLFLLHLLSRRY